MTPIVHSTTITTVLDHLAGTEDRLSVEVKGGFADEPIVAGHLLTSFKYAVYGRDASIYGTILGRKIRKDGTPGVVEVTLFRSPFEEVRAALQQVVLAHVEGLE